MEASQLILVGGSEDVNGGLEIYCKRFKQAFRCHSDLDVSWFRINSAIGRWPSVAKAWKFTQSVVDLRQFLRSVNPQKAVVWYQYGNGADLLALRLARRWFAGRLLCTIHASEQWIHLRTERRRRIASAVLGCTDMVCALSSAQEAGLAALGLRRLARIPTLLPAWHKDLSRYSRTQRSGALYAGRLCREKGVFDVLYALHLAREQGVLLTLDVAGCGSARVRADLEDTVRRLGLQGQVNFLGIQAEGEVFELMRTRQVFIYPSYADTYSLSIIEAVLAGAHPVAYDIPGTHDIITSYGGSLVPIGDVHGLADAMIYADRAPQTMAAASRLQGELAWEKVIPQYLALAATK